MATVLDIGILGYFTPLFTFILIFVIMFAVLMKTKLLGDNEGLNALASFCIALIFVLSSAASELIRLVTPWFVVIIVFAVALIMLFLFMGVKPEAIGGAVMDKGNVWIIIIVLLVLFGGALTQVIGPDIKDITDPNEQSDEGFMTDIGGIIFNPRILGALVLLIIISFAVKAVASANG